jgi:hypothetical protein
LFAASPKVGKGHLLAALETSTNDGPWTVPDSYRKFNGVLRYTQGDQVNGLSLTAMVSDIDYFFASRLPGEPLGGIEDIHFHPAVPRTIRISAVIGF